MPNTKNKYRSRQLESLHELSAALHRVGALDKVTMREMDAFCLTPIAPISPAEIQALRTKENISQAVLAHHLNVGPKVVSDWECGVKRPSGPSLKLLTLARTKGLDAIA